MFGSPASAAGALQVRDCIRKTAEVYDQLVVDRCVAPKAAASPKMRPAAAQGGAQNHPDGLTLMIRA